MRITRLQVVVDGILWKERIGRIGVTRQLLYALWYIFLVWLSARREGGRPNFSLIVDIGYRYKEDFIIHEELWRMDVDREGNVYRTIRGVQERM